MPVAILGVPQTMLGKVFAKDKEWLYPTPDPISQAECILDTYWGHTQPDSSEAQVEMSETGGHL